MYIYKDAMGEKGLNFKCSIYIIELIKCSVLSSSCKCPMRHASSKYKPCDSNNSDDSLSTYAACSLLK